MDTTSPTESADLDLAIELAIDMGHCGDWLLQEQIAEDTDEGCLPSKDTVRQALLLGTKFLRAGTPRFRVGASINGSVNFHWKTAKYELLLAIQPNGSVDFYGEDMRTLPIAKIKGKLGSEDWTLERLAAWLREKASS